MLHPEALWAFLLAIPITIAFLYKGRRRPWIVPSIAIWREAIGPEGRPRGYTRLREWILLAVNLGLLALLIGASAAPGEKGREVATPHWAFVVDVSPSMAAAAGEGGHSRLAAAVAEVRRILARLPPSAWVTLVEAGTEPVFHGPVPAESERLGAWLDGLAWRPGPSRLAEAWPMLRAHPHATGLEVVFLSDGAGVAGLEEYLRDPHHGFVKVGDAAPNAGIVGATLERTWGDAAAELLVDLRAAADGPLERSWVAILNGKEIGRGAVKIPPGPGVQAAASIPTYASGLLELRLEPSDGMPLDDRAFLALAPLAKPWVWVVSGEEATFLAPALAALEEHVDREASGRVSAREFRPSMLPSKGVGLVAFDGADPPAGMPPVPSVYFGSGGEHLPLRTGPATESPAIARWDADHPLLRNAPLEMLQVQRARRAIAGRADRVLIESPDGVLSVAGSAGGQGYVWFGFRLQDSNLPVLVAYPLLLKNVVSWFAGRRSWLFRPAYRCGEPVTLEAADAAAVDVLHLRGADGRSEGLVPVAGRQIVLDRALAPGWYAGEGGGLKGAFGVNLFDAGEADVRATATPARPPTLPEAPPVQAPENPDWVRFALWALAVMGVEWLLFHSGKA